MMETLETAAYVVALTLIAAALAAWLDPWHSIASYGLWMGCSAYVKARRHGAAREAAE
jgi:hypothetical protein